MKNLLISTLIITSIFFIACNNDKKDLDIKEIQQIDSTLDVLSNLDAEMKMVDTAKISYDYGIYMSTVDNFKIAFPNFPEGLSDSSIIATYGYYGAIKKSFRNYLRDVNLWYIELNFNKSQLAALKEDYKNDVIELDSLQYYLDLEMAATNQLNLIVTQSISEVNMFQELYDSIHPIIVNELKLIEALSE